MSYILKHKPEDFIVKEIFPDRNTGDNYALFELEKVNKDMFSCIDIISKRFNLKKKEVGYAGIKDKRAITYQHITLPKKVSKHIEEDRIDINQDIRLKFIKETDQHIALGDHEGNHFEITIRDLDSEIKLETDNILNLFGEQRFGDNNHDIGRCIIRRNFAEATNLIVKSQDEGHIVREHLDKAPNDHIGALGKVKDRKLIFFVHSYQSMLWNNIVKSFVDREGIRSLKKDDEVPIPGFGSECEGKFEEDYNKVLSEENINERDFIVRELPKLSCEGDERKVIMNVEDFRYEFSDDEEFKTKKKCKTSFSLGKGSYATVLIGQLFQS